MARLRAVPPREFGGARVIANVGLRNAPDGKNLLHVNFTGFGLVETLGNSDSSLATFDALHNRIFEMYKASMTGGEI